ncbi:MAG: exonuclease domain-containing protein [Gemmatimonadota bacterium]
MRLPLELDRPLVFFDLETTGLDLKKDRIVEMALIKMTPHGDVLERVRRFDPEMPIPAEATAVHGITNADVADEEPFCRRARGLAKILEGCDLSGFNVRTYDIPMLIAEFKRCGVPFSLEGRRIIDVQNIFHREEPRDLSAAARFYLDRDHEEAHSALGDIRTSAAVLAAQLERYEALPRDIDGLHAYCEEFRPTRTEVERWFTGADEGRAFRRGKHSGRPLDEVARTDPGYLEWMLGADDMDEEVCAVVRKALQGTSKAGQGLTGPDNANPSAPTDPRT